MTAPGVGPGSAMQTEIPVLFLHGTDEPAIPVDLLIELTARKTNMTVERIANAGELLFLYHQEKLISAIAKMADKVFPT